MIQDKKITQEPQELSVLALTALKQASLEARKVAIQTNTNLIIYDKEKGVQTISAAELLRREQQGTVRS